VRRSGQPRRRREYVAFAARNAALSEARAIPRVAHVAAVVATQLENRMGKPRFRSALNQALFVLLIMAGATASVVFDVRAVARAMAVGTLVSGAVAITAPAPLPPVAGASAAERKHGHRGTLIAWLAR
jgi:hypothetical protein